MGSKVKDLISICRKHYWTDTDPVVIREPYLPYIPEGWNGILILAEAQNLSTENQEYVDYLESLSREERMTRLNDSANLAVGPWDDGSLKLAALSIFPAKRPQDFAVGNAILWSSRDEGGRDMTAGVNLIDKSILFWEEVFQVWDPEYIICAGRNAIRVISVCWGKRFLKLRSPSRRAISRISKMFDKDDLLQRYPEVAHSLAKFPEIIKYGYEHNKIFYACHAVSIAKALGL